ncbi:MAG: hypothetical protein ACK5NF_05985 [Bacilli bacterium]
MVENEVITGREELYNKLKNIEIAYDAFVNNINVKDVEITGSDASNISKTVLSIWDSATPHKVVNILLIIYMTIIFILIIYCFMKDKSVKLYVLFTFVLLGSVLGYRYIEANYKIANVQICIC